MQSHLLDIRQFLKSPGRKSHNGNPYTYLVDIWLEDPDGNILDRYTEIGVGIMQDSEYNWAHPFTDEFADRFIRIYLRTVDMLKIYPSILCWVCMNEPGLLDTAEKTSRSHSRSMDINPGPVLYEIDAVYAVIIFNPHKFQNIRIFHKL